MQRGVVVGESRAEGEDRQVWFGAIEVFLFSFCRRLGFKRCRGGKVEPEGERNIVPRSTMASRCRTGQQNRAHGRGLSRWGRDNNKNRGVVNQAVRCLRVWLSERCLKV